MNISYPDPWNFSNNDPGLRSPDGQFKVEFGALIEIAMGAPIGGPCFLIIGNKKIEIYSWCGGPVIWNNSSDKIALPIWTKNRAQQIAVVDLNEMTITTFKEMFRVLHFDTFNDNLITGIDSPIYMTSELNFNIDVEEIESVRQLIN